MMASGLDCNDATANKWAGTISMKKSSDWTQYTLNLPMAQTPGEYFHYCNPSAIKETHPGNPAIITNAKTWAGPSWPSE